MPADLCFSLKQARRMALAAQGFSGRQAPAQIKAAHLNRLIERLGVLQIDSVNALVRSHYLPVFSRLGSYSHRFLNRRPGARGGGVLCLNTGGMRRHCCPWRCTR